MSQIAYQVFRLNLAAAGVLPFIQQIGLVHIVEFQNAAGQAVLDGMIECSVGEGASSYVPLRYNSKIALPETVSRVDFRWAAQADTFAIILFSPTPRMLAADTPPTRQIVTSSIGTTVAAEEITCDDTAAILVAADATRQSVLLKNLSGETVYLGDATVTAADGYPLEVGAEFRCDKSTADLYGVTATAGGATLRTFVEAG
jgi:hypothetical protein